MLSRPASFCNGVAKRRQETGITHTHEGNIRKVIHGIHLCFSIQRNMPEEIRIEQPSVSQFQMGDHRQRQK